MPDTYVLWNPLTCHVPVLASADMRPDDGPTRDGWVPCGAELVMVAGGLADEYDHWICEEHGKPPAVVQFVPPNGGSVGELPNDMEMGRDYPRPWPDMVAIPEGGIARCQTSDDSQRTWLWVWTGRTSPGDHAEVVELVDESKLPQEATFNVSSATEGERMLFLKHAIDSLAHTFGDLAVLAAAHRVVSRDALLVERPADFVSEGGNPRLEAITTRDAHQAATWQLTGSPENPGLSICDPDGTLLAFYPPGNWTRVGYATAIYGVSATGEAE